MAQLTYGQQYAATRDFIFNLLDDVELADVAEALAEPHPDADHEDAEAILDLIRDAMVSINFD